MIIYFTALLLVMIFVSIGTGLSNKKINNFFYFLAFLVLFLVSALRVGVGTDYYNYNSFFSNCFNSTLIHILDLKMEFGFSIICLIISKVVSSSQWFFAISSFVVVGLIMLGIRKYSVNVWLSVFLYITTMCYFSSFNALRQWIATAIVFYFFNFIRDKRTKEFILLVILASFIHLTALILIPIYFIVKGNRFNKRTIISVCCLLCASLFFKGFLDILLYVLRDSSTHNYSDWFKDVQNGVNVLKIILLFFPILLEVLFVKKEVKNSQDNETNILLNISLMNVAFMVLALRNVLFSRFYLFLNIYNILLIPRVLDRIDKKYALLVKLIIVIVYLMYMFAVLPNESNLLPYTSVIL